MGRHRIHDAATADALMDGAELVLAEEGVTGLTIRRVAERVGVSTRAVYSTFGSKEALLQGLGVRAYNTLGSMVAALPRTDDPAGDLVSAGVDCFRTFAVGHPGLFRIGIQLADVPLEARPQIRVAADQALPTLIERIERLRDVGGLDNLPLRVAALQFHALCEGLAANELRGALGFDTDPRGVWDGGLTALVTGWHPAGTPQLPAMGWRDGRQQ